MTRTIVERDRREPRFAASIEVHIEDGGARAVSVTREVSRSGLFFFSATLPRQDTLSIVLHPGDEAPIGLRGIVRYSIKQIGVGIEIDGAPSEVHRYRTFVDRIERGQAAWSAIGHFVRPPEDDADAEAGVLEHKEIVPIGETCRAMAILFVRFPPVPPALVLPPDHAKSAALGADRIRGLSREPVGLRLHARDRLRSLHVALLHADAAYAAVLPPEEPGDTYRLYALSGTEEIAISAGGNKIFPQFTAIDLELIRRDVVVRLPPGQLVRPPKRVEGTATDSLPAMPRELLLGAFAEWTRFAGAAQHALELLLDQLDPETRIYQIGSKQHAVRLLRSVPVLVREDASIDPRACALMHDGKRLCALFGLETGAPQIRPLTARDEIMIRASS